MNLPWKHNPEEEGDYPWEEDRDFAPEEDPEDPSLGLFPPGEIDSSGILDEVDQDLSRWLIAPYVDFTEIPAWQQEHRYALRLAELLRGMDKRVLRHPALIDFRGQTYLVAVDIAYGHDEGYGPGKRQLNLQRCKQSLKRLHQCLNLLEALLRLKVIPEEAHQELFDRTIQVRDSLVHWMEEVRRV